MQLLRVSLEKIHPNPWNPNRMEKIKFDALKTSLKEYPELLEGQRIIVREIEDGYEIINGEHRFNALTELGEEEVFIQNLGEIDDDKAKFMTLALANVGEEDDNKVMDIINNITDSFDLKNIANLVGMDYDKLNNLLDKINENLDDTDSVFEIFSKYSTESDITREKQFFEEFNDHDMDNDLTGRVISTDETKLLMPSRLNVMLFNHNPVRSAIIDGIDLGHTNYTETITEACKCFIKEEKERLAYLEEKKKLKEAKAKAKD